MQTENEVSDSFDGKSERHTLLDKLEYPKTQIPTNSTFLTGHKILPTPLGERVQLVGYN